MSLSSYLKISEEVEAALKESKPVVALESTIISHGMPFPQNLETAMLLESTVRKNGAAPATIAVINGCIKIGLDKKDLELLSNSKSVLKASTRDLPSVVSQELIAATTVSATMACAKLASIRIFATGGIGGVHRNAATTFDISADLTELSRTDVAVVSSGVKSILDIGLTLEYLETVGVPVIGYRTDEFPAFFTRESGFKVNHRLDSAEEIAKEINIKRELGMRGGILIANPIPEEYSIDPKEINAAIEAALAEAEKESITGKEVTPFLLSKVNLITSGKSLESNIKLAVSNAELASKIARHL